VDRAQDGTIEVDQTVAVAATPADDATGIDDGTVVDVTEGATPSGAATRAAPSSPERAADG
jgi:hypothetical protein